MERGFTVHCVQLPVN